MQNLINAIDNLPMLVKIILALPGVDLVWVIYRLCRSLVKQNIVGIVIAIAAIIIGLPWLWIVDILCLILLGKVWWLD